MTEIRKQLIELLEPYMEKDFSIGLYYIENIRKDLKQVGETFIYIDEGSERNGVKVTTHGLGIKSLEDMKNRGCKILGHYDISAIWNYLDSINNKEGIGPYYFDSISIRKDYYNLTPAWDNLDYLKIPNKKLELLTEEEEKKLYNDLILIKKLGKQ